MDLAFCLSIAATPASLPVAQLTPGSPGPMDFEEFGRETREGDRTYCESARRYASSSPEFDELLVKVQILELEHELE